MATGGDPMTRTALGFLGLLTLGLSLSPAGDGKKEPDLPLVFADDFAKGAEHWQPTDPAAWRVVKTDKGAVYNQFQQSKYKTLVRSPFNIALVKDLKVTDFVLEAKVQSTG